MPRKYEIIHSDENRPCEVSGDFGRDPVAAPQVLSSMPPSHHAPGGGFRTPWFDEEPRRGFLDLLRWRWQRLRSPLPPPRPDEVPRGAPDPAPHRSTPDEIRATWLGHASFLLQIGPVTVLTDPVFGHRASPVSFAGPTRLVPAPLAVADLPPVDAVVLSHDHYDHLDEGSVRGLRERFGDALTWVTPLGYADWFADRGVRRIVELDWWESAGVESESGASVEVTATPAQHWTRRGWAINRRLWASYALRTDAAAVYFGGDSGWFDGYGEIGRRTGPFDLVLMPVGAYEPRWFMREAHMNPEEAVRAYRALGERGGFVGMHWGTFQLTDEALLEPPKRTRAAWSEAGLPTGDLHEPGIGGTVRVRLDGGADRNGGEAAG